MPLPLRHRAIQWMAWATIARVGEDGLHLIGRLVLARLLWPEAFGTFTLAAAVVAGIQLCCGFQVSASLVQRPTVNADVRATAFWSLAALGLVGVALLLALAGSVAATLGDPGVAPVLRILSALVVVSGCGTVQRAWLWRELGFRQLAGLALGSEGLGTAVAIGAAVAGAGVYALAVHALTVELAELVVLWVVVPWRPHRHWSRREFLELWRFGGPLVGRRGLDYVASYGDRFLVGYSFGPGALGLYALALRLARGIGQGMVTIFERVAFPIFAHTQDDLERSRRGFLDALRLQAAVTFPPVIGVALVAPDLVLVLLGGAWVGAVPLLQILAWRVVATSLMALPRAALTGRGRQWLVFALSLSAAVAFALGWLLGLPWGPTGIAAGGAAAGLLLIPLSLWMVRREVPIGAHAFCRALLPALVGTASMALGVALASWLLPPVPVASAATRAAVLILAGSLSYVLPLAPWLTREVRRYLRRSPEQRASMRGQSRPSAPGP
jgi:O-antigen/teichoic acid export membrane protein